MIGFHEFENKFLNDTYSLNEINQDIIISNYREFNDELIESENLAIEMIRKSSGINIPDDIINIIKDTNNELDDEYDEILKESLNLFLEEKFRNLRFDDNGMCLKSQLISKACQMRFDEDMLGVVRGIDENNLRYLFVDFGDEAEVKVDIDELIISGQKK